MSIQRRKITLLAATALLALVACNSEDTGTRCGVEYDKWSSSAGEVIVGEEPIITDEQIMQDGVCETFVCLNHYGIPPYCSRTCDDDQNECPDGFTCAAVQDLGAHAGDRYCVFSTCEKDSDCLDVKKYACTTFASTSADEEATFKRCQPRSDN